MSIEKSLSLGELRPVAGWLRLLPPAQRWDPCFRLYETSEHLMRRLSEPDELDLTQAAAQTLSTWAEGCLDEPRLLPPLGRALLREPRLLEFGLLVHAAALLHATEMPRSQGFYPAVLLQELLDDLDRRPASPAAVRLLGHVLAEQHPEGVASITRTAASWPRGYGTSTWPPPSQAHDLTHALAEIRPLWERLAGALLGALPTPTGALAEVSGWVSPRPGVQLDAGYLWNFSSSPPTVAGAETEALLEANCEAVEEIAEDPGAHRYLFLAHSCLPPLTIRLRPPENQIGSIVRLRLCETP